MRSSVRIADYENDVPGWIMVPYREDVAEMDRVGVATFAPPPPPGVALGEGVVTMLVPNNVTASQVQ